MPEPRSLAFLIVEDEALILEMHRRTVVGAGHRVLATATTLQDALDAVASLAGTVDAALLDLNLHGAWAEPVAKALQAAKVPFLVLTGYSDSNVRDMGIHAPVLSKPFHRIELAEALEALCRV